MAALDELAAFIVSYCDAHPERARVSARDAVGIVYNDASFPRNIDKQAVLYGFATEVGATAADGFDPDWGPPCC